MSAADLPDHSPDNPDETDDGLDRRSMLRNVSTIGMAALMAPIAMRPNAGNPITDLLDSLTGNKPAPSTPPPAPTKPPAGPKPKDFKPKGYVKASNTPLADAADIPVNEGRLFEADEYVVGQPKPGKFVAYDSLCTHEGCPLDVFETPGEMACSCHSGVFHLADGKPKSGPVKKPMPKKVIIVEDGKIYKAKKA